MQIELKTISVKALSSGFSNKGDLGVTGFDGKLDIRPKYQREFVYNVQQQKAVIQSILQRFPLNVFYWSANADSSFELLDGQQRTLSICNFIKNEFSIDFNGNLFYFKNLPEDKQSQILEYELMTYVCKGAESEKLEWFKVINTVGEKLTPQELRNAVYTGPWLSDAKAIFSNVIGKGVKKAIPEKKKYVTGTPNRQEILETAISWLDSDIESYMSRKQFERNANELWLHFDRVIAWVETVFPNYRKEMSSVNWGELYKEHHNDVLDSQALENEISELMSYDSVTNKRGCYAYVLSRDEKCLNIRAFNESQRRQAYEKQLGVCCKCNSHMEFKDSEADHIKPWSKGGKTEPANCQMLCKPCNKEKSNKEYS